MEILPYTSIWLKSAFRSFLRKVFRIRLNNLFGFSSLTRDPAALLKFLNQKDKSGLFCNAENSRFACNHHYALRAIQLQDLKSGIMPVWLYMVDQNAMINSIESRSPLLDYRLIKYLNLPLSAKIHNGYGKFALRRAIPSYVDQRVTWRKKKEGFPGRVNYSSMRISSQ